MGRVGPYQLQAAIAAVHDEAPRPRRRTGRRSSGLYEVLARVAPSPVVALNRAVAVAQWRGPRLASRPMDTLAADPAMADYRFFHAARAELLRRLGHTAGALAAYDRALALGPNRAETAFLAARRRATVAAATAG